MDALPPMLSTRNPAGAGGRRGRDTGSSRIGDAARSVTAEQNSTHGLRHPRPAHRISRCETDRMTPTTSIPRVCRTPRTFLVVVDLDWVLLSTTSICSGCAKRAD